MRGPIDYIIVGFEGNKFEGKIVKALEGASNNGTINVLALALVSKDTEGNVTTLDALNLGDEYLVAFSQSIKEQTDIITQDDIDEVGDLLENNTTAGLLVIEQLWAKPLKQALIEANGVLVAEGRIHPDATAELNEEQGE
jgi:hypothetical protein